MARNDGVDRTFARNRDLRLDKKATPQSAYEHNERTKESYSNADIVPERTPLNVHYKTPVGTYEECFDALEQDEVISTWGTIHRRKHKLQAPGKNRRQHSAGDLQHRNILALRNPDSTGVIAENAKRHQSSGKYCR